MIFCVEDDDSIRDLMIYTLHSAGFEAGGFPDGAGLLDALQTETPQLIMLDIMLPGEDGISVLKSSGISRPQRTFPSLWLPPKERNTTK